MSIGNAKENRVSPAQLIPCPTDESFATSRPIKDLNMFYLLLIVFEGKDVPPSQYTCVTRALRPNQLIRARGGRG
jgi:hypothetical protein